MTAIPLSNPSPASSALWKTAQAAGVVATVVLVAGLVIQPDLALFILWNVLIPLVPLSLMVSPLIWRNVCPLATLNMAFDRQSTTRKLTNGLTAKAGIVAIVLLAVLVPARRFAFNTDGISLAIVIVAVGALALLLGMVFDAKAGFCNAICPVLPVERLYGQAPLLQVPNARCPSCSLCTQRGCIDLAPDKSVKQTLGTTRQTAAWLRTGFGAFAAAFPGFIVGYYTSSDVALSAAGSVYLYIGAWALGSYLLVTILVHVFKLQSGLAVLLLGGLALSLYYWYAVEVVLTAMGIGGMWPMALRGATLLLIGVWLAGAVPRVMPRGASS
jgi:nitrite reductase (NADH) large subunit